MLKIGMLGPDYLRKRNGDIFQQQQIKAITIYNEQQLSHIDGLLITGWNTSGYIRPLQRLLPAIQQQLPQLSVFGIAAGAVSLGLKRTALRYGLRPLPCAQPRQLTTASLEMPAICKTVLPPAFYPGSSLKILHPTSAYSARTKKAILLWSDRATIWLAAMWQN